MTDDESAPSPAAKKVRHYVSALRVGFAAVRREGLIRLDTVLAVQAELEQNRAGLRTLPGTVLTTTKAEYYRLLQTVRAEDRWAKWCIYLLRGVALTARSAITLVKNLRDLMQQTKEAIRERLPKIYSQDLLNNLFHYPYTKIESVERDLGVSRVTAGKYLELLTGAGFVQKQKIGKTNFYINTPLFLLLSSVTLEEP